MRQTYYSRARVVNHLNTLAYKPPSGSTQSPRFFWERSNILNIQKKGESQTELRELFGKVLHDEFQIDIDRPSSGVQTFVYLDDAVFSGSRVIQDIEAWIPDSPSKSTVYICIIVSHTLGEHWASLRIGQIAKKFGKDLNLKFWKFKRFENRKANRDSADVLWPTALPDDDDVEEYLSEDSRKFEFRKPRGQSQQSYFSSEASRKVLEDEFLRTGVQILNSHLEVAPSLKPLGFSKFQPGFGSLLIFYRNCPNNCPLALWWDVGNWKPLFPRKTYQQ